MTTASPAPQLPEGLTARPMTLEDVAAVHRLEVRLFPVDAWAEALFREELSHPTREYTVIAGPEGILAYAGVMTVGDIADVQTIAVLPEHEGRGLGRWLMHRMHAQALRAGAEQIILEARADNPRAIQLYTLLGYRQISTRRGYYRDGADALIMRRALGEADAELGDTGAGDDAAARDPQAGSATAGSAQTGSSAGAGREPLVLGIESSCDETGIGIVRGSTLLTNTVSSSMAEHVRFGGVIPEIASRAHLEAMIPALEAALTEAGVSLEEIDALAVTSGPGLAGALMVGVSAAKAVAAATGKPLYAVNHLVAHVGVGLLDGAVPEGTLPGGGGPEPASGPERDQIPGGGQNPDGSQDPARGEGLGALLVSGGHTEILEVRDITGDVRLLGATLDDAAGEAYDKIARILGLGYPGGPAIDRAARGGDPRAFAFPRGLTAGKYMGSAEATGPHRYDFSFSGLKTAVARVIEGFEVRGEEVPVADIAASFQEAVADVITRKAMLACTEHGIRTLLLGGGVAANSRLRELTAQRCAEHGIELVVPRLSLCTDNGAMVAALGARLVAEGRTPSGLDFTADPGLPVSTVAV